MYMTLNKIFALPMFISLGLAGSSGCAQDDADALLDDSRAVVSARDLVPQNAIEHFADDARSIDDISKAYTLRPIALDEVPPDVSLIRVDDSAELLAILDRDQGALARRTDELTASPTPNANVVGSALGYRTCSTVGINAVTYRVKLYGSLALQGSYGPYTIAGVNQWTALEGLTFGAGWTQSYAYSYNRTTYADVFGGGTLDLYLVIQGGIRIYSTSVNMSLRCYAG